MTRARTTVADVTTVLRRQTAADLAQAAGENGLLSRAEQAVAPADVRAAAEAVRAQGGPGTRVRTDAVQQQLEAQALRLIGSVNQSLGSGAALLSRAEATAAFRQERGVGERVLRAYEVASGNGLDVDQLAENRVTQNAGDDTVFLRFATEQQAMAHVDPEGKSVLWLVDDRDGLLEKSFTSGRNDLWAERFVIDRLNGRVTVTAEH